MFCFCKVGECFLDDFVNFFILNIISFNKESLFFIFIMLISKGIDFGFSNENLF